MGRVLGELTNLRNGPLSYWRAKAPFHAGMRLGLGLAQMFMAVFSAGFTTLLTLTSRLMFHSQERK